MNQAKVPSDIDIEDKIIGPLTLKQFIYLIVGAMILFILYSIFRKILIIFILCAIPVLLLTFAFTFYRFNEQPFEKFIFSFISFYRNPKIRIWRKNNTLEDINMGAEQKREINRPEMPHKDTHTLSHLDELALTLDSRGWEKEKNINQTEQE